MLSKSGRLMPAAGMTFSIVIVVALLTGCARQANTDVASSGQSEVPAFWVRPGYSVKLAAENIEDCRFLQFDDKKTLYVSRPRKGDILALRDKNSDGFYETRSVFASGYKQVHGMYFHKGWLWFAQSRAIHKTRDANGDGKADQVITVIPEGSLPGGNGHWWRPILVTDQYFYTSVGDSGNISDETATERQKMFRFNLDGSGKTLWASGIRNTEKYLFRPGTEEIWGADHGSDNYGGPLGEQGGKNQPVTDLNPPCEFNKYVQGGFYGHPFVVGNKLPRLEYKDRPDILELANKTIPPEWSFGGHWAPNGFTFLTKDYFGEDHKGDAFVAFHGSWNSLKKVGYRVERVLFDDVTGKPYGSLEIVGTLGGPDKQQVLARPVDCVEAEDGSVLFSCDDTGKVFRIVKSAGSVNSRG